MSQARRRCFPPALSEPKHRSARLACQAGKPEENGSMKGQQEGERKQPPIQIEREHAGLVANGSRRSRASTAQ